jgi:hypothetical protein
LAKTNFFEILAEKKTKKMFLARPANLAVFFVRFAQKKGRYFFLFFFCRYCQYGKKVWFFANLKLSIW